MFDRAVREVTEKTAGVRLSACEEPPDGELCTVHITFHTGFHTSLSLCADAAMLRRMARAVVRSEKVTAQDLEDFTKEYFNLLCGRIAAALFRATRVAARFSLPEFYHGRYEPEGHRRQFALNYSSERRELAQLVHHVPCQPGGDGEPAEK